MPKVQQIPNKGLMRRIPQAEPVSRRVTVQVRKPKEQIIGYDPASPGGDYSAIVVGHREGKTVVVDKVKFIQPKKKPSLCRQTSKHRLVIKQRLCKLCRKPHPKDGACN